MGTVPQRQGQRKKSGTAQPPPAANAEVMRHLRALGLENLDAYRTWCREHGFQPEARKSWQERRQERLAAKKSEATASAHVELARHLQALGIPSSEQYAVWCREHGFSDALHKSRQQRRQELLAAERAKSQAALAGARRHTRRPHDTIRGIYAGEIPAAELQSPYLRKIHDAFAAAGSPDVRDALLSLLLHAQKRANLFGMEPVIGHFGEQAGNTFIEGLLALARHWAGWLRSLDAWRPETHNSRRQFGSLARHLLTRYPVPAFMDAAWFAGDRSAATPGAEARRHQEWFLHVGAGQNIRTAELPVHLTRKMAHHFLEAPADYTIEAALRWGQILGLGGDEHLVRAVVATRLGESLVDEPFWVSVLHFFVNNPMLDTDCVGPIVDYIYDQKYVPREIVGPDGGVTMGDPPQPDFLMKGRTPEALLRRVEEWHAQLAREERKTPTCWEPCGIGGFHVVGRDELTGNPTCWTIQELLTSKKISEEGKAMHHCVGSYARSCGKGHVSVWSMQVEDCRTGARRRVMTISLQNARKVITQARGRCNRLPGSRDSSFRLNQAPAVLSAWAKQEGLTVPKYL
jgi:hypothetical protein